MKNQWYMQHPTIRARPRQKIGFLLLGFLRPSCNGIVLAGLENLTCLGRQPFKPGLRENRLHSECLARSTQFTQP